MQHGRISCAILSRERVAKRTDTATNDSTVNSAAGGREDPADFYKVGGNTVENASRGAQESLCSGLPSQRELKDDLAELCGGYAKSPRIDLYRTNQRGRCAFFFRVRYV